MWKPPTIRRILWPKRAGGSYWPTRQATAVCRRASSPMRASLPTMWGICLPHIPSTPMCAVSRRSRAQRWRDAIAELVILQSHYAQWFEALQAIVDLDLDELIAIVPPRGFGRD